MNYELAKELKDTGFPQKKNPRDIDRAIAYFGEDKAYIPNLSELIEACNPGIFDEFLLMTGYTDKWEAVARYEGEADIKTGSAEGQTPEEAVAKLWLALNKKS